MPEAQSRLTAVNLHGADRTKWDEILRIPENRQGHFVKTLDDLDHAGPEFMARA